MQILFDEEQGIFHLQNAQLSYVLEIVAEKYIAHRYFGKRIRQYRKSNQGQLVSRGFGSQVGKEHGHLSLNELPQEYPAQGSGDYRLPAYSVKQSNGAEYSDVTFKSWRIFPGKPKLAGLPATFAAEDEALTLELVSEDSVCGLRIYQYYTIFRDLAVISRHQRFENFGSELLLLENAKSASLEFPKGRYEWLSLYGAHCFEGNLNRHPLYPGIQKIESRRGASSPQHQPFLALVTPATNQYQGLVYGMHLVYSGNFVGEVEVEQYGSVRAQIGLNPATFSWELQPEDSFTTPEAILNFSDAGLNKMSQTFHKLYQNHLVKPQFAKRERPILLNTWEAMYFEMSIPKIEALADKAQAAGIELFVLDDGWFGERNDDTTSLGDWEENLEKIPGGIKRISEIVHDRGMQFGLWFEPEMVSRKSRLFQQHPDWALQVPDYPLTESRNQYVLDLTNPEVQAFVIDMLRGYLQTQQIDYIKWDMNRHLTQVYSVSLPKEQAGEVWHRFILGLYYIMEVITGEFPEVLFESCSSGGGRFDSGILYYMPQTWTSDNTDALCRSQIQTGYSLLYPPITMGAHVSQVPNHQVGRITPLETRYQIARFGNLGYELDLLKLSDEELLAVQKQIAESKKSRALLQFGEFYRLEMPDDNYVGWLIVSVDKKEAELLLLQKLAQPSTPFPVFTLRYLNPDFDYLETGSGQIFGGDELMSAGLTLPRMRCDFYAYHYHFEALE